MSARTLYVHRALANPDAVLAWAKDQGFTTTLAADDLHTTIAYSKAPVEWDAAPAAPANEIVARVDGRSIERFGDAVVLRFASDEFSTRWQQFRDIGASWDYPEFRPHLTVTYQPGDVDIAGIQPYLGPLEFGPEVFAEVDPDWAPKETIAAMALTSKERDALPESSFAVPSKRALPMHDATHVKLAWDMVDRTEGLSDAERKTARARIKRRAKELGVDTSKWDAGLKHEGESEAIAIDAAGNVVDINAAAEVHLTALSAMSLQMPHVADHPNKMPFSGVMTRVDTASDMAVGGAGGKKTFLPRDVAEAALPSLLGMPIDFTQAFDGHDVRRKIGTITAATIEGDAIQIEGFFFAADFPIECARIQQDKDALGFSYEIQARTEPMGDLLKIVSGIFTGAAVLRKDKAAYQSTSLAASAEKEEIEMTKEEFEAMFAAALKPVSDALGAVKADIDKLKANGDTLQANQAMRERVKPHSDALRSCAASMEAAGIGLDSKQGHAKLLHNMAASMDSDAAAGKLPHIYRDHDWMFNSGTHVAEIVAAPKIEDSPAIKAITDNLAALGTKLEDIKASAFRASPAPERKTLPADLMALLAKGGITETPKDRMTEAALDKVLEAAGIPTGQKSIALKMQFAQAGLLAR